MRSPIMVVNVAALSAGTSPQTGAPGRHDDKPRGMMAPALAAAPARASEGSNALEDDGTLFIGKNGVIYHTYKAGTRVRMRDGQVMEATDGTRHIMKNDAIWRSISARVTPHPSRQ